MSTEPLFGGSMIVIIGSIWWIINYILVTIGCWHIRALPVERIKMLY